MDMSRLLLVVATQVYYVVNLLEVQHHHVQIALFCEDYAYVLLTRLNIHSANAERIASRLFFLFSHLVRTGIVINAFVSSLSNDVGSVINDLPKTK